MPNILVEISVFIPIIQHLFGEVIQVEPSILHCFYGKVLNVDEVSPHIVNRNIFQLFCCQLLFVITMAYATEIGCQSGLPYPNIFLYKATNTPQSSIHIILHNQCNTTKDFLANADSCKALLNAVK